MVYTNQTKLEAYLSRALTANELVNLTAQIAAVSNSVAAYLNRNYLDIGVTTTAGVANTVRYYDGSGEHLLFIDDFISIASIDLLDYLGDTYETVTDVDDYINNPLNQTIKDSVYLRSFYWPGHEARAKITGKFTSGVLPDEVAMLVTSMVANNLTTQALGISADFESESIEGYSYKRPSGDVSTSNNSISQYASVDHLRKIVF